MKHHEVQMSGSKVEANKRSGNTSMWGFPPSEAEPNFYLYYNNGSMMLKDHLFILILFLALHLPHTMSAQTLTGTYRLEGIQDMAAAFRFSPEGQFEFFYIYGVADRQATGTYTIENNTVKLRSDKLPGHDFSIQSQTKSGSGYTIVIQDQNDFLRQTVLAMYFAGEIKDHVQANDKGVIRLDIPSCDTLYLRHEIYPDIPTLIKDKDNENNYFEVSLLPSLGQVSFKGIDLFIDGDTLTCYPNYFMPFDHIRFVRE